MRLGLPRVPAGGAAAVLISSACLLWRQPESLAWRRPTGQRLGTLAPAMAERDDSARSQRAGTDGATWVTALHRFAVKGLDRDSLQQVTLRRGGAFPYDRRWALHFGAAAAEGFAPSSPQWLHKSNFLCAFTANALMASFETRFDDATCTLTVSRVRGSGARASPLLRARLDERGGRERVEAFFSNASGRAVALVSGQESSAAAAARAGDDARHHQFGNTRSGVAAGDGSTRTVH